MKSIWKFELESQNPHLVMPVGAKILCVQAQRDVPCIWVEVDPESKEKTERTFMIVATGHPIEFTNGTYIGTFQLQGGDLVYHLYELSPA